MKTHLLFLIITLLTCALKADTRHMHSIYAILELDDPLSKDDRAMIKSVKGFLKWYKKNYTQANSFRMTQPDLQGNYQVRMSACEGYLAFLKQSTYISDSYLNHWRQYFKDRDKGFQETPQDEGPPEGFDYDLVLGTQEPDLIFNAVDNLKFIVAKHQNDIAVLEMMGEWRYYIDMIKENGKWMISNIRITDDDSIAE